MPGANGQPDRPAGVPPRAPLRHETSWPASAPATELSSSGEFSPPDGHALHAARVPNVRIRSFSTLSAFDAQSPRRENGGPASPRGACLSGKEAQPVSGPATTASSAPDLVVNLRRATSKATKVSIARTTALARYGKTLRRLVERRFLLIILAGVGAGCFMHALLFWQGVAPAAVHAQPRLALGSSFLDSSSVQRRMVGRGAISWPGGIWAGAWHWSDKPSMPLGMPGDSDRLANTTVWDAKAWRRKHGDDAKVAPEDASWPNTVAICALMKSEHPDDVVQWIRYHKWIGVDEIFLKENSAGLPGNLVRRVQPFIDEGFLHLGVLPGAKHPLQNRWYNRCSKPDMAGRHSWIAFIDLDEFMVVLDGGEAAFNPDIKAVTEQHKQHAGLSMQWVIFGSSGHDKRPTPGGPLAHFFRCTGRLSYQMKCMANMFYAAHHVLVANTVHDCTFRYDPRSGAHNPPAVTSDGAALEMYPNTEMTNPRGDRRLGESHTYYGHLNRTTYDATITPRHTLALFHYVTRSLEDYTTRKIALPSGIYTHNYVTFGQQYHKDLRDHKMLAHFEHAYGFDGNAPVCRSVRDSFYVARCCSAPLNGTLAGRAGAQGGR